VSSSVTPASIAAWMVATLSASSVAPYIPDIPMQPSPKGNTEGPVAPSFTVLSRVVIAGLRRS